MKSAVKILQGDCLERLKKLEANTLDSLVTDPPAGISFMGKIGTATRAGVTLGLRGCAT